MRALIVDDERLARNELRSLLAQHPQIEIVGEAENAHQALEQIQALAPDLLFLDIQMPGKNGFELLEELGPGPEVIFVTAYDQYALRAFEASALDYLLKPVDPARLSQALSKLNLEREQPDAAAPLALFEKVFLREDERCWFVRLQDISAFESIGNYSRVYFDGHKPLIRRSLNQLEARLPEQYFFRASRQFIVNLDHILDIETAVNGNIEARLRSGIAVEMSRRQSLAFRALKSL